MKKLVFAAILAAAAAAPACGNGSKESTPEPASLAPAASPGGPKKTAIHFTTKPAEDDSGDFTVPCIGVVSTERVFRDKGEKLTWKIKKNNGESNDDKCDGLVVSQVNLRFKNPMAVSPNPAYAGNNGHADEIEVTVSSNEPDYNGSKLQKYQVFIGNDPAGPDPIIIVNCGSCGPGGGGPGGGGPDPD